MFWCGENVGERFGECSMHEQGFINSTNACESIENNTRARSNQAH